MSRSGAGLEVGVVSWEKHVWCARYGRRIAQCLDRVRKDGIEEGRKEVAKRHSRTIAMASLHHSLG